ncbi:uncharacterized protein LOC117405633 isoform X1 [Acipenser ruthenus]|uniref:uncharacterized protein LOC117405633 isoform X1 n=1 Tax=Acipenser ruthenus TaxID=7906 RepID=UPI00274259D5|nr:uncharacterized protein LOC117405633 isoform X1 [Acipenser ruthenus]
MKMLRRGHAVLPFLLAWVLRLTQALASAHDRLQDEAAANSMSGTGNLDRGGNLSLLTVLNISYAEDLFSEQNYYSTNGKRELSEIAGYTADQLWQSLDHVDTESDAANYGLFDFSKHYRHDEDAFEQPVFSNPDSDDFNSDLTKDSVPFVADEYPMASESEGDGEHVLFTERSNDPDADFPEVFEHADVATSDKENVSSTLDLLEVHDSVIALPTEMGTGEFGNEEFGSSDKYKSETRGYDSVSFSDLEKEGTDTLHPDVHSYHREDLVTGDLNGMHVSSFDRSVLTDINLELEEALSPAFKIERAHNSPDLSGGHTLPTSVYDASIGPYGVFNLPITQQDPLLHSTGGEPTTSLASATTCGVADMTINLFGGRLTDLKVRAPFILVEVSKVVQRCQYMVLEKNGVVIFTTAFKGCNVKALDGHHVLTLMWRNKYVNMSCPIPTPDRPITICGKSSMTIKLPAGPIEALRVKDKFNKWVSIYEVAVKCKYQLLSDSEGRITFTTSYNGCHVRRSMDRYFYNIYYQMAPGKLEQAVMSCRTGINVTVPPEESLPSVFCGKSGMMIKLPKGSLNAVKVRDGFGKAIPVRSIAKNCNYQLFQMKTGHIILIASFQSCQIAFVDGCFALSLQFQHADRVMGEVSALCHAGEKPKPTSQPETPTTQEVTSSILSTVIPADVSATICNKDGMSVVLPSGPWWGIRVKDLYGKEIIVTSVVAERCHYELSLHLEKRIFTTTYTGCFVEQVGDRYVLTVMYRTATWNRGSVRMECPTSAGSPTELPPLPATVGKPIPVCRSSNMTVVLPAGSLEKVLVLDEFNRTVKVIDAPKSCNYSLVERRGQILFTASYSACDVKILNGNYVLAIIYTTYSGDFASVQIECPTSGEPTKPIPPTPVCGDSSMMVELPEGPLEQVKIMNKSNGLWVAVKDVPKNCNYTLMKERGRNLFITSYKACHVRMLNKNYVLSIRYMRMGSAFFVNMRCPVTETTTGKSTKPAVVCRNTSMMVELPEGSLKPVQVIGKDNRPVDISDAFIKCGYLLVERGGKINLTAVYTACDVKIVNKNYTVMIIYTTTSGKREMVQMSCPTRAVQPTAHTTRKPVTTEKSTKPTLPPTAVCKASSMTVELPSESLQVLLLNLSNEWVDINAAPSYCNYSLVQGRGRRNFFTTPYKACDVRIQSGNYILKLSYITPVGREYLDIRCPIGAWDPTPTSSAGDPTPTSSAGDPTLTSSAGDPTLTSSAGDPTLTSSAGDPTLTSSAGDPTLTSSAGDPTRTSSAGDPTLTSSAGDPTPTSSAGDPTPSSAGDPTGSAPSLIFCNSSTIKVELPGGPPEKVKVMDKSNNPVAASWWCGYRVVQEMGKNVFTAPYTACDVQRRNNYYYLTVLYTTALGKPGYVQVKCPSSAGPTTHPSTTTALVSDPIKTAICMSTSMMVELPKGARDVQIDKSNRTIIVGEAPRECGYSMLQRKGKYIFTAPYTACDIETQNENYYLTLIYFTATGKRRLVQMKCPATSPSTTTGKPTKPTPPPSAVCKASSMTVELPSGSLQILLLNPSNKWVDINDAPSNCNYTLSQERGRNFFVTPYTACDVRILNKSYVLKIWYMTIGGKKGYVVMTCPTSAGEPTEVPIPKTTTWEPTRTTGSDSTGTTGGVPTKPTRMTRTTTRKPTRTTGGEPTKPTRTTGGEPTKPTRTTTWKPTRTTTKKPTRTTTRKPTRTTRTTTRKPTRTTGREPTKATKTTTRKPTRTTRTTTKKPTRTTTKKPTRTTTWKPTRTTTKKPTRTTTRKPTRTTRTTTRKPTRTNGGEPTKPTRTTTWKPTRTTTKKPTRISTRKPTRTTRTTTRKPTRTTTKKPTRITTRKPTRTTRTTTRKPTRTTRTTTRKPTRTAGGEPTKPTRTTTWKPTRTTTKKPTRIGTRKPTRTTRTTTRKPTRTTGREPTKPTRTPTRKPSGSTGEPTKAPTTVVCAASSMVVALPKEPLKHVQFLDKSNKWVAVIYAPEYCNYTLLQGRGGNFFITPYTACDVRILNENYYLALRYTTIDGKVGYVQMKCPTSAAAPTKTPPSTTTIGKPTIPTVCKASIMTIELPEGPIGQVALIDKSNTLVTIIDDTRECGYSLVHEGGKNLFTTPYTACDVKMLSGNYVLTLVYVSFTGKRVLVQMKCPTSAALPTGSPLPPFGVPVLCSDTFMTVELPGGLLQDIQLMDESSNLVAVTSAPKTCGYSLVRGNGKNILTAPYKACNVKILNNFYILRVLYTTLTGERGDIQAKCPVPGLVPREGCKIPRSQQVACGPPNADLQLCVANGCCVDATTSQCYYPLDACTADGHFVFAVYRTSTKPEIDPGSVVIARNHSCAPVICTPDFAIFRFPVASCGTHVFTVAETTIYLAEVEGLVRGNQQVYGQISRDGPYRLYVECRYSKGSLASTGYLVVNPPPPSAALAFGSLAVRLRIATDTSYTSFYPQSHLPLSFLLGSKVYLEVQLVNPPDPNVVLLVHYCIAYPQSSQAAWVILYEGCPNILDYSSAAGLHVQYDNTRRFEIQSFQFLDYKTKHYLDEEIYFMCSTEVCSPEHRVCNEGCFDGRDMPVPVDPGVGGRCAGKLCPGKSNIVKRAAHGHTGLIAVGEGTFILDENVPHEQTEKHWTYFHGLLGLLGLLVPLSVVMLFFKKWVFMQMVRSQRSSL